MTIATINITPARFGSVSAGTLRTEDLLEALSEELAWQFARNGAFYALPENRNDARRIAQLLFEASELPADEADEADEAESLVEEVIEELQNFAPRYGYFGAHSYDGAHFGFWLDEDDLESGFDGLKIDDLSQLPHTYQGEVMLINDHGNRTLYDVTDGKLREVWSIV